MTLDYRCTQCGFLWHGGDEDNRPCPMCKQEELLAENERLQGIIETLYAQSPPVTWKPRDAWGEYAGYPGMVDEVDPSNSGDVHAHGVEEGFWLAANRFREAAETKEKV